MKPTILFVDDEPDFLSALDRSLSKYRNEWDMRFAFDLNLAMTRADACDYDLVVSDFKMPGGSGLCLMTSLHGQEKTKDVPVIIITGVQEDSVKTDAFELGAVDFLAKPFEIETLVDRIRGALIKKAA